MECINALLKQSGIKLMELSWKILQKIAFYLIMVRFYDFVSRFNIWYPSSSVLNKLGIEDLSIHVVRY